MNLRDYERLRRSCKLASTYASKAAQSLHWYMTREGERGVDPDVFLAEIFPSLADEAATTLGHLLGQAETLAGLADVERLDELERDARTVAATLRRRRLALALADTSGRSPEEAAAFQAGAARLKT